jgi:hypothetical protein
MGKNGGQGASLSQVHPIGERPRRKVFEPSTGKILGPRIRGLMPLFSRRKARFKGHLWDEGRF